LLLQQSTDAYNVTDHAQVVKPVILLQGDRDRGRKLMSTNLTVGMNAPDFSATTTDGSTVTLQSLVGKRVVLYFYPKDDTSGCTREACAFRDSSEAYEALNTVVFGVSADSLESHQRFSEKYNLNFQLLHDPQGTLISNYGAWKSPGTVGRFAGRVKRRLGRDPRSVDRITFLIDEQGVIRKIWNSVNPSNHDQQVLHAIQTL